MVFFFRESRRMLWLRCAGGRQNVRFPRYFLERIEGGFGLRCRGVGVSEIGILSQHAVDSYLSSRCWSGTACHRGNSSAGWYVRQSSRTKAVSILCCGTSITRACESAGFHD